MTVIHKIPNFILKTPLLPYHNNNTSPSRSHPRPQPIKKRTAPTIPCREEHNGMFIQKPTCVTSSRIFAAPELSAHIFQILDPFILKPSCVFCYFHHTIYRSPSNLATSHHHRHPPLLSKSPAPAQPHGHLPLPAAQRQFYDAKQPQIGRIKSRMRGRRARGLRELVGAAAPC